MRIYPLSPNKPSPEKNESHFSLTFFLLCSIDERKIEERKEFENKRNKKII